MDDINVRLARAEQKLRQSRLYAVLAFVTALASMGMVAGLGAKLRKFGGEGNGIRVQDSDSTALLTPGMLEFRDRNGKVRVRLGFVGNELPGLYMMDKNENIRVRFDLDNEGSPVLRYFDERRYSRAAFGVQENNPAIILQDDQATPKAIFACKDNQPKIELRGEDETPRYMTASKPRKADEVFCLDIGHKNGKCSPE